MAEGSYNQFCPVSMASEILCTRWTMLVLRELVSGSTRFNELRRGLPRMSPALLSKRLRDLEAAGIVTRTPRGRGADRYEYALTEAGRDLTPVVMAVGSWGQKWVTTKSALDNLDPNLLMWDMRRNIDADPMPARRSIIQFIYNDLPKTKRNWWLIVEPGEEVDLCSIDPGFDVDLYVVTDLRTMTAIWMGYVALAQAQRDGKLSLTGDRQLESRMHAWLRLSPFAKLERAVA
jgi:DNA-binding HxlR family transcriptional regulator